MRVIVAEDLTKELREFLEAEGALEAFLKNYNNYLRYDSDEDVLWDLAYVNEQTRPLWSSFIFEETPEGKDYWVSLAEKF